MRFFGTVAAISFILISLPAFAKPGARQASCRADLTSRPAESILVLGGGQDGALAPSLIAGIKTFATPENLSGFLTASRAQHPAWAGSEGHRSGIDRNDELGIRRLLKQTKPTVIVDAAGAHMAEAFNVRTVEEARSRGAEQARILIRYLKHNPSLRLIFISSQYADPAMKDPVAIEKTFDVVGLSTPVSVRLYAELKAGYEEELLRSRNVLAPSQFVILRLGTLLDETYRAKSAEGFVTAQGVVPGKNFTPADVLRESMAVVLLKLHKGEPVGSLFEISSKNEFSGPLSLGLRPKPLADYAEALRRAWGLN